MLYETLLNKSGSLVVVGLGYVGLPLAIEFAKKVNVVGFDLDQDKIEKYQSGIDVTDEVGNDAIINTRMSFTTQAQDISKGNFIIVAVPTPIKANKEPDLSQIQSSCELIGKHLSPGSIVVFESTVYPGVTEEVCIPILEKYSKLQVGKNFSVGYSPERINPGDKKNTITNIVKIVSGYDQKTLDEIEKVYAIVVEGGIHRVSSIKTAEATKLAENTQRDINIAFMNELAMFFDKVGISTHEVVEAMNTKWNALGFSPGLVGGHCIGIDPYYFIYQASMLNFKSSIVSAGRRLNDEVSEFITDTAVKLMIKADKHIRGGRVWMMGLTFKENCPDIRNTKVVDMILQLEDYGMEVLVSDPLADKEEAKKEYGITLVEPSKIKDVDCIILAVNHNQYKSIKGEELREYFKENGKEGKLVVDIKSVLDQKDLEGAGLTYWSL